MFVKAKQVKFAFLLKMYQFFHSCEDNPGSVIIVLIQAEQELWKRELEGKRNVFFLNQVSWLVEVSTSEEHPSLERLG